MFYEVVVIVIRGHDGHFFAHQRRADKDTFPNLYGLGAGGRVDSGERPVDAAKRELAEETGLRAEPRHLFDLEYRDCPEARLLHAFEVTSTRADIRHNQEEWQWSGWMTQAEVELLRDDKKLCPDTALLYAEYGRIRSASI